MEAELAPSAPGGASRYVFVGAGGFDNTAAGFDVLYISAVCRPSFRGLAKAAKSFDGFWAYRGSGLRASRAPSRIAASERDGAPATGPGEIDWELLVCAAFFLHVGDDDSYFDRRGAGRRAEVARQLGQRPQQDVRLCLGAQRSSASRGSCPRSRTSAPSIGAKVGWGGPLSRSVALAGPGPSRQLG